MFERMLDDCNIKLLFGVEYRKAREPYSHNHLVFSGSIASHAAAALVVEMLTRSHFSGLLPIACADWPGSRLFAVLGRGQRKTAKPIGYGQLANRHHSQRTGAKRCRKG